MRYFPIGTVMFVGVAVFVTGVLIGAKNAKDEHEQIRITHGPRPEPEQHELPDKTYKKLSVIRLNDGTRCVVVYAGQGVSVTCDWSRNDIGLGEDIEPEQQPQKYFRYHYDDSIVTKRPL